MKLSIADFRRIISRCMADVGIIGAGELGGSLAHRLAQRDLAASVVLVDEAGRIAEGKALDIMQSAPIARFSTQVTGSTEITAAAAAALVFVADSARAGEWQDDEACVLLKRIRQLGSGAVIVCAGAGYRTLIERGVRELQLPRARLIGSAPEALASALRAVVALETGGSPRDVALTVLGVPPSQAVVPWEDAAISGFSAAGLLDERARRRLTALVPALWPPGPYALASAAVSAAEAILGRSHRSITAFVAPDDSLGRRFRTGAWPVRLGPSGIVGMEMPELNPHDRIALDNAMLL
jgi:malate dehydrogenase